MEDVKFKKIIFEHGDERYMCADVPLRNYSLTDERYTTKKLLKVKVQTSMSRSQFHETEGATAVA